MHVKVLSSMVQNVSGSFRSFSLQYDLDSWIALRKEPYLTHPSRPQTERCHTHLVIHLLCFHFLSILIPLLPFSRWLHSLTSLSEHLFLSPFTTFSSTESLYAVPLSSLMTYMCFVMACGKTSRGDALQVNTFRLNFYTDGVDLTL